MASSYHIPRDYGLTAKFLRTLYTLEEPAGILWHKQRPVWMFTDGKQTAQHNCNAWNARFADRAVCPNPHKYSMTSIQMPDGRLIRVYVHHIIECLRTGKWPKQMIDHVNGDSLDNSSGNHRPVTDRQSAINRCKQRNNTSGVPGVYWHSGHLEWIAYTKINGKQITIYHGGSFDDAVDARKAYVVKHHGRYARK